MISVLQQCHWSNASSSGLGHQIALSLLQFYGAALMGQEPMLLVEYCEGGDLRMALNLDNNLHKVRSVLCDAHRLLRPAPHMCVWDVPHAGCV